MKISELTQKRILIAGYGREGKVTEKFLKQYVPTAHIGIADAEEGPDYLAIQSEYDLAIRTPGIPLKDIQIPHTTATNLFFANCDSRHTIIGVTGSKGKSTTASLIYHILKHAGKTTKLLGNIGQPMLTELLNPPSTPTIYVLELSSYQLEDIEYSPTISVIVSLFPDHIPHHGSVESYYTAKHRILSHAGLEDFFVYNPEFPLLVNWADETPARTIPYRSYDVPDGVLLRGEHNKQNMRAALTVSEILEIPLATANKALTTFQPLPHRLQFVGTFAGMDFYDDAISTTPESTIAAINTLENISILLLGGEDRGYDFTDLAKRIKNTSIHHIILFPDSGIRIKRALQEEGVTSTLYETTKMEDAVGYAFSHAGDKTVCLLSCASPSYSLWKNFEEKGDQFQQFVKAHAKKT